LILTATPVWWSYGLFAHPITTALLLFFTGLATLCRYARVPPLTVRLSVLGLFSAALMFRFDCILLFIVVFALLWANRKLPFIELAKEFSLYLVGSVFLFLTAQRSLPAVTEGDAPKSLLTLLSQYQNLALFLPNIRSTLFILVAGFTGLLLLTVPISAWLLYRRRNYPALLLVSGFIAVNLIFWIPNPGTGARHFLMMAPAMSTSGALVVVAFFSWNKLRVHFPLLPWAAGVVATTGLVSTSEMQHHSKEGYYFRSPFEWSFQVDREKIDNAQRIAAQLLRLPPLGTPVVVLSDSTLVIAEMEKLAGAVSATLTSVRTGPKSIGVHVVDSGENTFIMVEQSWDENMVRGFEESGAYSGLPILKF
jgi:hypothetical protein